MSFPINNFSSYSKFNDFEPKKLFNSYLKKAKTHHINLIDDNLNIQTSPSSLLKRFKSNLSTEKKKRCNTEKKNKYIYEKPTRISMNTKFINFCDDMKKSCPINKEIDKYNLKRQNNMNIYNMNYIYINSTFKNICPSTNKLLEKNNYNKKIINLYNKDNTHGIWSIGTADKVYKYRNLFNNEFNY